MKLKKIFLYFLIFSFLNFVGCYSSRAVDKEILIANSDSEPIGEITIITNENKSIKIDEIIYQVIDDTLYAEGINITNVEVYGKPIDLKIALADIQYVEINELNASKTAGCVIGSASLILLIIGFIALANNTPKSCEGPKTLDEFFN